MSNRQKLAIDGGEPIRTKPWPKWPLADSETEIALLDVLHSGRWAISGMYNGTELYERRFSEEFAKYNGVNYCVPMSNGSAALTVALEALGVGYGDEVLVPGVTWVACASAVVRIGAIPILVDVDPDTLCMSIEAARQAITARTKAIMLVHLYCTIADLDAFVNLSHETGIPLLEDCSQAHGALWSGKRVGSFGHVGVFSMQDTKVLSSGEGGAVITDDPVLHNSMQQLRSDGRRYGTSPVLNDIELEEVGEVLGRNLCLSEFQAAILYTRLKHLDEENRLRVQNANYLFKQLAEKVSGVKGLKLYPQVDQPTYYRICLFVELSQFNNISISQLQRILSMELGLRINLVDTPLNRNILYQPSRSRRINNDVLNRIDPAQFALPNAEYAATCHLAIHHRVLLGTAQDIDDIVLAFEKIQHNFD